MARATKDCWKNIPMPERRQRLEVQYTLTEEEFERVAHGHVPASMEDRWFIYFEDSWLNFHRSWTGHCIFQVKIDRRGELYEVVEAWVNYDQSEYRGRGARGDTELLLKVIRMYFKVM